MEFFAGFFFNRTIHWILIMGYTIKDNLQKFFGGILLGIGALLFFLGVAMYFTPDDDGQRSAGLGITIFSMAIILPGILLFYYGMKNAKFEQLVISAASIAKTARRITLMDLATKLNCPIPVAGEALNKALSLGLVSGNFDRSTDEFFTQDGEVQKIKIKYCPGCGAPLDKVYLQGETIRCQSCGIIQ